MASQRGQHTNSNLTRLNLIDYDFFRSPNNFWGWMCLCLCDYDAHPILSPSCNYQHVCVCESTKTLLALSSRSLSFHSLPSYLSHIFFFHCLVKKSSEGGKKASIFDCVWKELWWDSCLLFEFYPSLEKLQFLQRHDLVTWSVVRWKACNFPNWIDAWLS